MDRGTTSDDLVDRAVGGDKLALEQLLLERSGWLARLISNQLPVTLRSAVDVDDVLQQTFVHAFRGIGRLQGRNEHSFNAWVATIGQNQLRDTLKAMRRRKRNVERRAANPKWADNASSMAQLVELLSDRNDTPQHQMARKEGIRAIQVGVASLAPDQQQAIRLHVIDDMTLEETARVMNRSPDAVRGLIHRGKQHLREMLGRSSRWLDKKS